MDCNKINDLTKQIQEEQSEIELLESFLKSESILSFSIYYEYKQANGLIKRQSLARDDDWDGYDLSAIHKGFDPMVKERIEKAKERLKKLTEDLRKEVNE